MPTKKQASPSVDREPVKSVEQQAAILGMDREPVKAGIPSMDQEPVMLDAQQQAAIRKVKRSQGCWQKKNKRQ